MNLQENIEKIKSVMGLLSEQTTKVYTDKKAYDKALQEYNNQMLAYSWTNEVNKNQSKIFGKQNNDTSNYINQYINWNALQTPLGQKIQKVVGLDMKKIFFGVDFLLRQRRWKPNFPEQYSWGKLFFDKLGVDRNDIDFFYIPFEGFQWMVFEKPPIKPILQQAKPPKVPAPTTTAVKPTVQQPPKQEPNTPTPQKPLPDGSSVFGPGNSLIGFIKDRKFTPVDSSMMPNQKNYYGKWDWDLLHDKQKLKDYLKQKFGNYLIYENNVEKKLIKEQETYTFTNKSEYEKALKIYNKAKKLSDESLRRFNLLKKEKFKFDPSELKSGELYGKRRSQLIYLFLEKNNLKSDDYFEKYLDLIKPVRTYVLDLLINYPEPKTVTDYIHVMTTYKPGAIKETPKDYDRRNFSWHLSTWGTIYEPIMPKPILQTQYQINPNFQTPPKKISSTPSEVIPIAQQPFKSYTPEQTQFSISWTPDLKCLFTKYYETYDDLQKDIRDFDLPLLGSRTEGKPPKYADYRTEKRQGKNFPEGPWFNSCTQKWDENLNESMKVDDYGRLHDEDTKILYPYNKIKAFMTWFNEEYRDRARQEGWEVFESDSDLPKQRYKFEPTNKFQNLFQVQKIDSPGEGEAIYGELMNDDVADKLAKKLGLMLDEYGVVIGWKGKLFIT